MNVGVGPSRMNGKGFVVSFPKHGALFARALCSFVLIAGCNAVLGNEKGYLVPPDAGGGAAGQGGYREDASTPRADASGGGVGGAGGADGEAGAADVSTGGTTGSGGTTGAGGTSGTSGAGGSSGTTGAGGAGGMSGAGGAGGDDRDGGIQDANRTRDVDRDGDEPQDAGPPCDGGIVCDQRCTDVLSDPRHCGRCGQACATDYACVDGRCDSDVVEVAAGSSVSCVVLRGGQAWCWGSNQVGQLGDGSLAGTQTCGGIRCRPQAAPVVDSDGVNPMQDVAHVSTGIFHVCAVKKTGSLFCWGLNTFGQLGHSGGDASCMDAAGTVVACNPKPTLVALPGTVRVGQISAGLYYSCALTTTGDVYCWGNNAMGQLGLPIATTSVAIPTRVSGLAKPAIQIGMALQGDLSCALLDDGTVWCWGHSIYGAAGHDPAPDPACGTSKCNPQPKVVADSQGRPVSGVASIGVGRTLACALTQTGSVMCWGWNGYGVLGNGTTDYAVHAAPQLVPGLPLVTALLLGDLTTLAIDSNGSVWGWGRNNFGVIGDGTVTGDPPVDGGACTQACRRRPTRATVSDIQQLAMRGNTSLAIAKNGSIWVWGENGDGELGHTPGTGSDIMCGVGANAASICDPRPTVLNFVPVIPPVAIGTSYEVPRSSR
jgi:alpha-tubulin suppressor-like RCC1 family protein